MRGREPSSPPPATIHGATESVPRPVSPCRQRSTDHRTEGPTRDSLPLLAAFGTPEVLTPASLSIQTRAFGRLENSLSLRTGPNRLGTRTPSSEKRRSTLPPPDDPFGS